MVNLYIEVIMILYYVYMSIFILIHISMIAIIIYKGAKSENCQKITVEKIIGYAKNLIYILMPSMIIQMLAYYEVMDIAEVNTLTLVFVGVAIIYLLETICQFYKARNYVPFACKYECEVDIVIQCGNIVEKKGYYIAPKSCVAQLITDINVLEKGQKIKNKRVLPYTFNAVLGIILVFVGMFLEEIMILFA